MTATLALIRDTFREALARKIFWGFIGCSTVLILFFIFIMRIDVVQGSIATISLFGASSPMQDVTKVVRQFHAGLAVFLYTAGMFLAIFASGGLISSVFEPGRIELLLSKPIPRHHILLGRYLGNVLVIAANMVYLVVPIWIIFGLKAHVWTRGFLMAAALTVFVFAVLLTIVLLLGVLWESAAVSIMVTFGFVMISVIVSQKSTLERLLSSEWSRNVVRAFYYGLPKVWDVGRILSGVVMGDPVTDWMPLWSTALFGLAVLSAGLFCFSRRDF